MEFIGINSRRQQMMELPSVALNFNGKYIEEEIEGYQTLNVSGREMMRYDIQSDRRVSGNGSIRYGKTLPSRVVSVQYRLEAESPAQLQYKFNALRRFLHTEDVVPLNFYDEPGTTYYGEFESADEVPEDRLTVVSRFTLFCPDPYKYGDVVSTNGEVVIDTFYPTVPSKIIIETESPTNSIDITNGPQTIRLRGEVNTNSTIEIDVVEQTVFVNGIERLDLIDLHSDFENFTIKNGQTVTSTNGMLKLEMREVV